MRGGDVMDFVVAGIIAIAAIPSGIPMMVVPLLFPDLARPILWTLFTAGPVLSISLFGLAAFVAMDRDPAAKWRRKASRFNGKVIRRGLAAGLALLAVLTWLFWPTDPLRNQLPGFSAYAVVSLENQSMFRRQYVFSCGPKNGPRADLYMSASNQYTFSITDAHGEPYPLEINVGADGIPTKQPISIVGEVAVIGNMTILRISVNGKDTIRRTLPFPIDLGRAEWKPARFGTEGKYRIVLFFEYGAFPFSLSNNDITALHANAKNYFKL
jgi:hypothetical protein